MLGKFSQNLINDTISYFKNWYSLQIDEEIAKEYLVSLAKLYNCFEGIIEQKSDSSDFRRKAKSELFCLSKADSFTSSKTETLT
jgi:hypothetical protein